MPYRTDHSNALREPADAYAEYLLSPRWRAIREAMLWMAGYRCQVCNASHDDVPLEVHHRDYARLGAETPQDLICLCSACHPLFHQWSRLARGP